MPRRKKPEPVVVEPRPEPEGQGDWLYSCTSCGYQRKDDASFNQPCPKCHGHGWQCHWLKMIRSTIEKSDGKVTDSHNGKHQSTLPKSTVNHTPKSHDMGLRSPRKGIGEGSLYDLSETKN